MSPKSKEVLEQKEAIKVILALPMSLEEKMDELWHLPGENLVLLLEVFEVEENYEICQAIKAVLDERQSDNNSK